MKKTASSVTIFAKSSILDVCQSSEYTSAWDLEDQRFKRKLTLSRLDILGYFRSVWSKIFEFSSIQNDVILRKDKAI